MKNTDRLFVYLIGFGLGVMLVWGILSRREARQEAAVDPWVEHNVRMIADGTEPLPDRVPAPMLEGRIINFGYLPMEGEAVERVWHLSFEKSYPYVRVVEDLATGEFSFMAADQVIIRLADGTDVTELKPMLDELGLRMRMFNRKEDIAVIGVFNTEIDAVPATLEAIQRWRHLFQEAHPDGLRFQNRRGR